MEKKKHDPLRAVPQTHEAVQGQPDTAFDLVNKYGTYEIQPTADSDNEFPEIAQGLPRAKQHKELEPEFRGE